MVARGLPFFAQPLLTYSCSHTPGFFEREGAALGRVSGRWCLSRARKGQLPRGNHPEAAASRGPSPPSRTARAETPSSAHSCPAARAGGRAGGSVRAGAPAPPGRGRPAPALTQAAPAQRAVAAVQDGTELAQQRGRQVEQQGVHRERAAGPAGPRRRAGHGSAARDQGPGGGGMRGPDLCTPARGRYTTAEILLHGCGQDCRTRRTQVLEGAGPA